MTRWKPGPCLAAVAVMLLLAVLSGTAARAEASRAAPESRHRVEHEALIDLGVYVDCVTWRYVVRENETLGEIAQRELGSAVRHREILALNAGLKPKKLWAGACIVMPPRLTDCQGKGPKWVFFAWSPDARGWASPRQLVEGAVHRVSHGARLYAVPAERLRDVLGQATEMGLDGRVLEREVGVARSGIVTLVDAVPDDDPTERIVTRWRVQDVAEGRIALTRIGEERYDASGRLLATASSSRPGTLLLVLSFLLMLAGLGFAVARSQRRAVTRDEEETLEESFEDSVERNAAEEVGGDLDEDYEGDDVDEEEDEEDEEEA